MKVGILGGTFNPIHNGHLKCSIAIRDEFLLDRVLFIPSKSPVHKKMDFKVSSEDRANMVDIAIDPFDYLQMSTIELHRETPSYSYETIGRLKEIYPEDEFYFILGVDSFNTLDSWKNSEKLMEMTDFIVMLRPGEEIQTELLKRVSAQVAHNSMYDISSTEIRQMIRDGKSLDRFLPGGVMKYIKEKGLYQN